MFNKRGNGSRGVNFLWPLAGGYLIYLGGKLLWMYYQGEGTQSVFSILAGIVFMVVGGLVIFREWHLYRNGPREDAEDVPAEDEPMEETEQEELPGETEQQPDKQLPEQGEQE